MYQLTQSTHFVFIGFLVRSIFIRYLLNRNDSVHNQRRWNKSLFIWLSYCVNCILVFEGRFDSYLSLSIYSAHLHFISPTLPDHIENAIQILYRFMDHTPLQSHPSIHLPVQSPLPFLSHTNLHTAKSVWIVETSRPTAHQAW